MVGLRAVIFVIMLSFILTACSSSLLGKASEAKESPKTCMDSDGGFDIYSKGTITLGFEDDEGNTVMTEVAEDRCVYRSRILSQRVEEFECDNDHVFYKSASVACKKSCRDGACI